MSTILAIIACLLFAWAVVATALAVFHNNTAMEQRGRAVIAEARVSLLEDSFRASSLAELRQYHPTAAMEADQPEPARRFYAADPTGLIVNEVEIDSRTIES